MEARLFAYETLLERCIYVFESYGFDNKDAVLAAKNLLSADLRGIDSHGIARLVGYCRLIEAGRINPKAKPFITHQTPSTAVINADKGLGLITASFGMEIAMEKAAKVGTGWVSMGNSSHFGIAGQHAMQALGRGMVGLAMTNASALVAPSQSIERLLGTNPISIAIPAGHEHPFVLDMATTTAANGKLELLQRKNQSAPLGWLQTQNGTETTDAHALKFGGALLPLGSDLQHGSHKGYGLGAVVDIFSGVFSGANFGPWVPPFPAYVPLPENPVGEGIGHFFGAMAIDAWQPREVFLERMDIWIKRFSTATPAPGFDEVLIPGEPERRHEAQRRTEGIPLHGQVIEEVNLLLKSQGIAAL